MRGDLSWVADEFGYMRCDGTIQEADLAEDLMVDGETYECVKSFCYLRDTLDGDGGADHATTARIRNGWMKFRELLPFLTSRAPPLEMKCRVYASCVRSSMTYGSETMPLLVDVGLKFERAEIDKEDVHDRNKWRRNVNVMKRKYNHIGKRTINICPIPSHYTVTLLMTVVIGATPTSLLNSSFVLLSSLSWRYHIICISVLSHFNPTSNSNGLVSLP